MLPGSRAAFREVDTVLAASASQPDRPTSYQEGWFLHLLLQKHLDFPKTRSAPAQDKELPQLVDTHQHWSSDAGKISSSQLCN
eukprot:1156351-Pelagomonas_calceolata.AAC.22